MSPGLAAALLLVAGCDALTFTEIPNAWTTRGTVFSHYVQTDSLRGTLRVILEAGVAAGADPIVRFDGQILPATERQGSYILFTHEWAMAVGEGEREGLPQVVEIPGSGTETDADVELALPVLLRDGPETLCVRADDPVLAYIVIPGSGDLSGTWRLSVDAGFEVVRLQGTGPPPDSIPLPRDFLGTAGPWTAQLDVSVSTDPRGDPGPVVQSAHAAVQWTLVAEESGDPACAATGEALDPRTS